MPFYYKVMLHFQLSVAFIAQLLGSDCPAGGETLIVRLAKIEDAHEGDISFVANARYASHLETTRASCVLVNASQELPVHSSTIFLRCDDPHRSFVRLIRYLQSEQPKAARIIHPSAVIAKSAQVADSAVIGAGVVIGEHSVVSESAVLHPGVVLGNNVEVGKGSMLYPGVVIYDDCRIGAECIIHANAVIGSDGFGYLENADGSYDKIPQIGNVVVDDAVEIGSGSCIDRAALGSTYIGKGVKIDNLVHIAHNVEVSDHTAIAAQCGIAGGTRIGVRNRLAGQVGVVGYIQTAADVTIGAQSGVSKSLPQAGVYSGSPAVELKQRLRQEATIRRLSR